MKKKGDKYLKDRDLIVDDTSRLGLYDVSRRLKSLNTTKNKLVSYRKKCRINIKHSKADIVDCDKRIAEIDKELAELQLPSNGLIVSEHALLRYLERYKGINLDTIAEEIKELSKSEIVQRGNTIVTIADTKQTKKEK